MLILVDPVSGRRTLKVSEWQRKKLSIADSSRQILVDPGNGMKNLKVTECS
jgi:hypothetical protein